MNFEIEKVDRVMGKYRNLSAIIATASTIITLWVLIWNTSYLKPKEDIETGRQELEKARFDILVESNTTLVKSINSLNETMVELKKSGDSTILEIQKTKLELKSFKIDATRRIINLEESDKLILDIIKKWENTRSIRWQSLKIY